MKVTTTPKIAEYLRNLRRSSSVTDMVQKREAGLLLPPKKMDKGPNSNVRHFEGFGIGIGATRRGEHTIECG